MHYQDVRSRGERRQPRECRVASVSFRFGDTGSKGARAVEWQVDWWALGICIHEMLAGYPPFYDTDAFKVYQSVLLKKVTVESLPRHFEDQAKDLLVKLLKMQKATRIGSSKNGAEDIKKHKCVATAPPRAIAARNRRDRRRHPTRRTPRPRCAPDGGGGPAGGTAD